MTTIKDIDCNCNDCFFMQRNMERHELSAKIHYKWQLDYFNTIKNNFIKKSEEYKNRAETDIPRKEKWLRKSNGCLSEANKMKFIFDKSTTIINYGFCLKFKKDVSFIPNTCQLDTQDCFENRRKN